MTGKLPANALLRVEPWWTSPMEDLLLAYIERVRQDGQAAAREFLRSATIGEYDFTEEERLEVMLHGDLLLTHGYQILEEETKEETR